MFTWNLQVLCNSTKLGPYGPRTQRCQKDGWLPTPSEVAQWNPSNVDTDRWIQVAQSFGAKYAVLVADHFSGFTLWPTKTYSDGYHIGGTKYKGGGANIVAEFLASCKRFGVAPGVFYSVHNNWHEGVNNFKTADPSDQSSYNQLTVAQLTELLGTGVSAGANGSSAFSEVWFDAGVDMNVNPLVGPAVAQQLAPTAVCHSCAGFDTRPGHYGLRWMGNEEGVMPLPSWSATAPACAGPYNGSPNASAGDYCPPSVDTVLREHYWFWYPNTESTIKPTKQLVANYLTSVGRAANLILNVAPDPTGAIPAADVAAYAKMGKAIDCLFNSQNNISHVVTPMPSKTQSSTTVWNVGGASGLRSVTNMSVHLSEHIDSGQLVGDFSLAAYARPSGAPSWAWVGLVNDTGIGAKRIFNVVFSAPASESAAQRGRPVHAVSSTTIVEFERNEVLQATDIQQFKLVVSSSYAVSGQAARLDSATVFDWGGCGDCV